MFKLDKITRGTWEPQFFDGTYFEGMLELNKVHEGIRNPISLRINIEGNVQA
jgi:hypothetical protein